jgi:hypothetical protein
MIVPNSHEVSTLMCRAIHRAQRGLAPQPPRDDADCESNGPITIDCHPEGAAPKLRLHNHLAPEGSIAEACANLGHVATQALDPSRRTGHPRILPI